jgi:hypothetical protein
MSILLARLPISAMAGATKPMIISGIINPRNSLKIELKVINVRANQSGNKYPAPIPRMIAIMMRANNPIFSFFMSFLV